MGNNGQLKVLIVASEAAPYAKSGGLGDVTGTLPKVLKEHGVDVRVVIPKYKTINNKHFENVHYLGNFETSLDWRRQPVGVLEKNDDIITYFIENDYYFGRDGYYGYDDDNERFGFFSKAVLEMLPFIDFYPDVIHCNDWQTGPICALLKEVYSKFAFYKPIKTLYTIHNLQYQGTFPRDTMYMLELPDYCYGNLEYYGQINYMKSGLMYADMINTVSETYAEEIKTFQYGYGLDGVMRYRNDRLCGILNGIDYVKNDPATDSRIYVNYDVNSIEGKKANKAELQKELGLEEKDVPMVSIISRLADQKGIDLVAWAAESILSRGAQFVVLGTGDKKLEAYFKELEWNHKGQVCANIMFDDTRAQRIYASSDLFLMPSLFEPCGLGQMFSLRYGTVPVVRKTGGLADTIEHYNKETGTGNGFVFEHYSADGLIWAVNQALDTYYEGGETWNTVVRNAMNSNFSWDKSAEEYIKLYDFLKSEL